MIFEKFTKDEAALWIESEITNNRAENFDDLYNVFDDNYASLEEEAELMLRDRDTSKDLRMIEEFKASHKEYNEIDILDPVDFANGIWLIVGVKIVDEIMNHFNAKDRSDKLDDGIVDMLKEKYKLG